MQSENRISRTRYLVQIAVLTAIMLLLEVTNLGFIRISVIEFTVMQIPVVIGAIVMGPAAGALLGGVFGLISFGECFGKSAFGSALLAINPVYTFLICMVGRILMGWLCGLIYKALRRVDHGKLWSHFAASASGALLNTLFFMALLVALFGGTDYIQAMRGGLSVIGFIVAMVGVQGLVEAAVCCAVGGFVSRAVYKALQ